jgi:hypothetical protein
MPQAVVNPITVEVVRNGLAHIANEMATVLRKTSYNMMIYEVRDYCVGIVDPDGNISRRTSAPCRPFSPISAPPSSTACACTAARGFIPAMC